MDVVKTSGKQPSTAEVIGFLSYINDPHQLAAKAEELLLVICNPTSRHFTFNYLEKALYRLRAEPGRSEQFERICLQHDSEIRSIIPNLRDPYDAHLPVIPMYKQMAIYKEKAGDIAGAMEWSKRGLALYRNDCTKPDYEEDLQKRIKRLESKLDG